MTYYSCEQCGGMLDLNAFEGGLRREHCPQCEETTVWTPEFEADEGMFP